MKLVKRWIDIEIKKLFCLNIVIIFNVIIICVAIGIKKKWKKNLDKLLNILKITWTEMQQNLKIVMRIKHHFKILLQKFSFTNYTYIYKFYYM